MKTKVIGYWLATAFLAFALLFVIGMTERDGVM
jgi:hypothetical protein